MSRGTVTALGSATATGDSVRDRVRGSGSDLDQPTPPCKSKSAQHPQRDVPLFALFPG